MVMLYLTMSSIIFQNEEQSESTFHEHSHLIRSLLIYTIDTGHSLKFTFVRGYGIGLHLVKKGAF